MMRRLVPDLGRGIACRGPCQRSARPNPSCQAALGLFPCYAPRTRAPRDIAAMDTAKIKQRQQRLAAELARTKCDLAVLLRPEVERDRVDAVPKACGLRAVLEAVPEV